MRSGVFTPHPPRCALGWVWPGVTECDPVASVREPSLQPYFSAVPNDWTASSSCAVRPRMGRLSLNWCLQGSAWLSSAWGRIGFCGAGQILRGFFKTKNPKFWITDYGKGFWKRPREQRTGKLKLLSLLSVSLTPFPQFVNSPSVFSSIPPGALFSGPGSSLTLCARLQDTNNSWCFSVCKLIRVWPTFSFSPKGEDNYHTELICFIVEIVNPNLVNPIFSPYAHRVTRRRLRNLRFIAQYFLPRPGLYVYLN